MRIGRRYGLSSAQKTEIWRRWKAGESLHEIGRAFGKDHGSIHFLLSQHGGVVPAVRRRSERTLTLAEREEISRGLASGSSIREIARSLQRAASTVSREVARHGGRHILEANPAHQRDTRACDTRGGRAPLRTKQKVAAEHQGCLGARRPIIRSPRVHSFVLAPLSRLQVESFAANDQERPWLTLEQYEWGIFAVMGVWHRQAKLLVCCVWRIEHQVRMFADELS
jgi:Helix-turn-helix domain